MKKLTKVISLKWVFYTLKKYMHIVRMEMEKVEKLVANLHEKSDYAIHIRNLKQVLNHGLVF